MGRFAFVLASVAMLSACSHEPLIPDGKNVTARREPPPPKCEILGNIEGRTKDNKGNTQAAIDDLKIEAARFGGNYVKVETVSGYGNAVRGTVYHCP